MILRREREGEREQRRRSDRTKAKELIERRARSRQSRSKRISGGAGRGWSRSPSLLESLY